MGNFSRIFRTIGVTGLAFAVNFLIMLVLVPYITDLINAEAYGWVKIAKDTIIYCTMLVLAIQEFSTRFIGVSYHNGDFGKANTYFNSVLFGDSALGLLLFGITMFLVSRIDSIFQISPELVKDVQLLFLFTLLKFLQMTVLAVFECGPMIANRMYIVGRFKLISYVTEAVALLVLFHYFQPRVYLVGIALLVSSIAITIPNIVVCKQSTPELKIHISKFSIRAVGQLVGNGIWASLNTLSSLLNNGCDLLITNWMLSSLRMGQLAIVQSISVIYLSLYNIVSPAFQPMELKCYSHGDHEGMMKWFYLAMKTCGCLCSLFFAGFLTLGYAFYQLWIPNQDIDLLFRLTVIAIIPAISGGIISPMFYAYTLTVKKMIPFFYSMACGILNVLSMIVLLKFTDLGLYAVVGTTAFYIVLNHLVANTLYVCHVLGEPLRIFCGNVARCLVSTGCMTGALLLLNLVFHPSGWMAFILCVVLYTCVGLAVYALVVFNREERTRIIGAVMKKINGRQAQ